MNLVAAAAAPAHQSLLKVVQTRPEATLTDIRKLTMPIHHDVRASNVDLKRLGAVLAVAYQREFHDFASLLLLESLVLELFNRWPLLPRSSMERPRAFLIRHVFLLLSAAKTGTHFPFLSKPTTKRYIC